MAVGMGVKSEGGEGYNGRMTSFVVLCCMIAATGGVIFGYDIGISGLSLFNFFIPLLLGFSSLLEMKNQDIKVSRCKITALFMAFQILI